MKDRIYIERIKKYAFKIFKYLEGIDKIEDFETNDEKVDAVIFNLEQIGETAKKITDQTKNMYKSIHWVSIIGLRNIISHDFEGVRYTLLNTFFILDIATPITQCKSMKNIVHMHRKITIKLLYYEKKTNKIVHVALYALP